MPRPLASTLPGNRTRQIAWAAALALGTAAFLALTFKVNAVRSEVRLTERAIIALKQETLLLETEFQTRASQRQLSQWNAVEFGYIAPQAGQLLESDRQLARLGQPRGLDAPTPIRVAMAVSEPREADAGGWTDWFADDDREISAPRLRDRPLATVALMDGVQ